MHCRYWHHKSNVSTNFKSSPSTLNTFLTSTELDVDFQQFFHLKITLWFLTLAPPQIQSLRAQSFPFHQLEASPSIFDQKLNKYIWPNICDQIFLTKCFGLTLAQSYLQWEEVQVQPETSGLVKVYQGGVPGCTLQCLGVPGRGFPGTQTKSLHHRGRQSDHNRAESHMLSWSWDFCGFSEDKRWTTLSFCSAICLMCACMSSFFYFLHQGKLAWLQMYLM